jgi:hypothetical protein
MKALATMTFATALLAALALAQTRRISLVKGSPADYGTNGFDISWVDNSTQKYYLGDRTNNAATEQFVEDIRFEGAGVHSVAVNASNNHIFVPVSGKGIFVVAPGK